MTSARLSRSIGDHGSDLSTWPFWARVWAICLLAFSPRARQQLAAARQWDACLAAALPAPDPAQIQSLQARLAAIPQQYAQYPAPADVVSMPAITPWVVRGALASSMAAVIGLVAGTTGVMAPEWTVDWAFLAYASY